MAKTKSKTTTRKPNPYTKRNLVQCRVDNEELNEIFTKAQVYSAGNISEYLRLAVLSYKPLKRGAAK